MSSELPGSASAALTDALAKRELVERAQRVLMRREHLTESEAFSWLARRSRDQARSIVDVAQAVLGTEPEQGR